MRYGISGAGHWVVDLGATEQFANSAWLMARFLAMRNEATIDRFGRIVIPKWVRDDLDLTAGAVLRRRAPEALGRPFEHAPIFRPDPAHQCPGRVDGLVLEIVLEQARGVALAVDLLVLVGQLVGLPHDERLADRGVVCGPPRPSGRRSAYRRRAR